MSYLNPNNPPNVVAVSSLQINDSFSRTSFGAPRPEILNLVAIYDDVAEAETYDGRTKTMDISTLVHKI